MQNIFTDMHTDMSTNNQKSQKSKKLSKCYWRVVSPIARSSDVANPITSCGRTSLSWGSQ